MCSYQKLQYSDVEYEEDFSELKYQSLKTQIGRDFSMSKNQPKSLPFTDLVTLKRTKQAFSFGSCALENILCIKLYFARVTFLDSVGFG